MCSFMALVGIAHNGELSPSSWPHVLVSSLSISPGMAAARHLSGPYRISRFAADLAEIAHLRAPDGAVLVGHSMGAAVCLEAAQMLGEAANHVIGIDALLFPELFAAHAARKSPAARVLLRTPLAARTIDSWVERFFVAPYDPAVRNAVRQTMLNTPRPVLADSVASLLRWQRDVPGRG